MHTELESCLFCPNCRESLCGVMCSYCNCLVKELEDVDARLCTTRRFEVCWVYKMSLKHTIETPAIAALV